MPWYEEKCPDVPTLLLGNVYKCILSPVSAKNEKNAKKDMLQRLGQKNIVTFPVAWRKKFGSAGRKNFFIFRIFLKMSIGGNRCFLTYSPVLWYMVLNVEL